MRCDEQERSLNRWMLEWCDRRIHGYLRRAVAKLDVVGRRASGATDILK
jgi:hypothetical protein